MSASKRHPSSFRDPSGYVFTEDGTLFRKVLPAYLPTYHRIQEANLYDSLWKHDLLVRHTEISLSEKEVTLRPVLISFISYPYEWTFEQYREAALHTLRLEKYLLKKGFCLKDASAFNIAFQADKPIFIDTLSIEDYVPNSPWNAYKQFVQHFVAPLVLASYEGPQVLREMQLHRDGFPIADAVQRLPMWSRLSLGINTHLRLVAKFENTTDDRNAKNHVEPTLSLSKRTKVLDSLYAMLQDLTCKGASEWGTYYDDQLNYKDQSLLHKRSLVSTWCEALNSARVLDLGGNTGMFLKCIENLQHGLVVDIDYNALDAGRKSQTQCAYLDYHWADFTNPTPALGFNGAERASVITRWSNYAPDVTLALALVHHLSLTGNIPFSMQAESLSRFAQTLILEFPSREDSWVQFLLDSKRENKGLFDWYSQERFENEYGQHYTIVKSEAIASSHRTLYLMQIKE